MNYLDKTGVSHLWSKIKTALAAKADVSAIPTQTSQLTNNSNFVASTGITNIVTCTNAQYQASNKDSKTLYIITD